MEAKIVPGNRRGKILVAENFRYHRHHTKEHTVQWRCWKEKCRAKPVTHCFDVEEDHTHIQVLKVCVHMRPPDTQMVRRAEFRQAVTEVRSTHSTIRHIFNAEHVQLYRYNQIGGDGPPVPSFLSVRSIMHRARAAVMPPIPATIDDQHLRPMG